jgi:serine O-acetyltransferase
VGQGPYKNAPIIGNHVYIGPGAVIQGPVVIDDNVIIAPNCVVTKSVPQYAIVAGVPAKIIGDVRKLDYDIFKIKNENKIDSVYFPQNKNFIKVLNKNQVQKLKVYRTIWRNRYILKEN